MSQRNIVIVISCTFLIIVGVFAEHVRKSSGAHPGTTGAPGDATCAMYGCHVDSFVKNGDSVNSLSINNKSDVRYMADSLYELRIRVSYAEAKRFGFEVVALDKDNKSIGTLSVPIGLKTPRVQVIQDNNRLYCTHTTNGITPTAPGINEWLVNWTAPSSYDGPVTFYYATNACNGDNANTGDGVFLSSKTIHGITAEVTGEQDNATTFRAWSDAAQGLHLDLPDSFANATLQLGVYNLSGHLLLLQDLPSVPHPSEAVTLDRQLAKGSYIVSVRSLAKVLKALVLVN